MVDNVTPFSIMKLSVTTFSRIFVQNLNIVFSVTMQSAVILCVVRLNVVFSEIMLGVSILNVMLSFIMLSGKLFINRLSFYSVIILCY
jgi:hypothetical protein